MIHRFNPNDRHQPSPYGGGFLLGLKDLNLNSPNCLLLAMWTFLAKTEAVMISILRFRLNWKPAIPSPSLGMLVDPSGETARNSPTAEEYAFVGDVHPSTIQRWQGFSLHPDHNFSCPCPAWSTPNTAHRFLQHAMHSQWPRQLVFRGASERCVCKSQD